MAIMGQDSLKANLTNPQRSFLFDVLIPAPVGNGDFDTLQVRARSSQVPGRSNDVINVPYKQTAGLVYPGKDKLEHTWACTFMEGEDKSIYNAIYSWQQTIVDNVAGINNGQYFTDVYLNLLDVTGGVTMQLKLKNAWISNMANVDLNYDNNSIVTYNVTFSYDYFEDQTA